MHVKPRSSATYKSAPSAANVTHGPSASGDLKRRLDAAEAAMAAANARVTAARKRLRQRCHPLPPGPPLTSHWRDLSTLSIVYIYLDYQLYLGYISVISQA